MNHIAVYKQINYRFKQFIHIYIQTIHT